jgi:chromosomal replication initiation ATPase DnaA
MTSVYHVSRPRRRRADPETERLCRLAQTAAAAAFGVSRSELRAPSRCSATIAFARQSAMYLAHVTLGLNIAAVANVFGRDRSTAVHACRLVEDRRDDPLLDAVFEALEDVCREWRAQP